MRQFNLPLLFTICLLSTLILPLLLPAYKLIYFAPCIVVCYYQKPFNSCLWFSFTCGIIMDLLTPLPRFGLYALNYTLTTALLNSKKKHFFEDSFTTLPFMTFFFAVLSTLIQACILTVFSSGIEFSWSWVMSDLVGMPFYDAAFAFATFNLPLLFLRKRPRRGEEYFSS